MLRHARGGPKVAPGRGARGAHACARLRDGLRSESLRRRLLRSPRQRHRRREAERRDAGVRGRRRRRDRLRPGRRPSRPRARLREDPGRLQLLLQLLRHPARPRRDRGAARRRPCSTRCGGVSRTATGRSSSPGSISAAIETARPAMRCRAWCARSAPCRDWNGCACRRSRSTTSTASSSRRCGRRRTSVSICTFRCSRATTACCATWHAAIRSATFLRRLEPLADFNLTTDAIVGFPTEDERAFRNTLSVVEAAGITKVHVFPYSPRPGTVTAGDDAVAARRQEGAERPAARGLGSGVPRALA